MKVYVDELPKSCGDCHLCQANDIGCYICYADENEFVYVGEENIKKARLKTCPLQPLTYYTKQVRNEVVQEIKNKIEQAKMIYEWKGKEINIEDILDQIQGETK